ncbi:sulfatase [Verrucomicrobiales bacterium BCK34]|nr:sulfatase [Verrucomicrobiales bacterium BCK34]
MMKHFLLFWFSLTLPLFADAKGPNFIFFLVDDLGWADVGFNGSTFHKTPNIDALAQSGVQFTNGYAAASVCSPTRASILTGRHPVSVNITDWIPGNSDTGKFQKLEDRDNLALEEVTIAEALKKNGYKTFFAGKWHLGDEGHYPEDQGFDINIGGHNSGSPRGGYYAPWKNPRLDPKPDDDYLTERLTAETNAYIEQHSQGDEPFLVYLSYYNVHTPIQPYKKHIETFEAAAKALEGETPTITTRDGVSRGRQDNPELASMVAAVDDSVGSILKKLDDLSIADNTVIIFFSDNGGLCTRPPSYGAKQKSSDPGSKVGPGCNLPLRSGKGWLYEGGIREATIVRAPGITTPGTKCDSPVMSTDFFPTILELAGIAPSPKLQIDGESIVDLLKSPDQVKTRSLYWHYPHYHGSGWTPGGAIRKGDWKLIEFWEHGDAQLFNLKSDLKEQHDLSSKNPDKKAELAKDLSEWRREIGAKMPEPAR